MSAQSSMHPETAHSVLPGALNIPGAQLAQLALEDAPTCGDAVPGSQGWHSATEFSIAPYNPTAQCEHAVLEVSPVERMVSPTSHVPRH